MPLEDEGHSCFGSHLWFWDRDIILWIEAESAMDFHNIPARSSEEQLATLRDILHRIAQAEHPERFMVIKQVIIEQVRELEKEAAHHLVAL